MQFELSNPTIIRFGKAQIGSIGDLIEPEARLPLYGGGSIAISGDAIADGVRGEE